MRLTFVFMGHKNISQAHIMQNHIEGCKASGMTIKAYCLHHQIKFHHYYYWQKKLQPQMAGKFISITPALSNAPVSIIFANGTHISFESMPAADYIKKIVS